MGRWPVVEDAAAEAVAAVAARPAVSAQGLVAGERTARDGEHSPEEICQAAALRITAVVASAPLTADRLVVDEQAVHYGEGGASSIVDGPALAVAANAGLVIRQDVVGKGQVAAGVLHAPAWGRPAVGDRQPGDGDRQLAADSEDPAGVVAADGQLVGARALDVQVPSDRQLAAGQRDGLAA